MDNSKLNFTLENKTDITRGLTTDEVFKMQKAGFVNSQKLKTSKSYARILFDNIFTWFNIICFALAGVLISVGSYKNITFILVFTVNLIIGIVQEMKAKRMVDKISVLSKSQITVLRDGAEGKVDIDKVVLGDIVILSLGDQICADCVVVDGEVEVNESLLSGESKPIKKKVGDTLFSGSFVVSGYVKAQAVKVGTDTYSASLIKKAREFKSKQSDILRTLNFIIKTIGVILIPLGILTFLDARSTLDLAGSVERSAASIIGMMPVGMFLLTSVSLVVGVLNLAKKHTLVQDLYSIEMLSRANVLCLDKTGTITDGTMSVKSVLPVDCDADKINNVMASFVSASPSLNATSKALKEHFLKDFDGEIYAATSMLSFSSERKFSAVTIEKLGTYMLGASEMVTTNLSEEVKNNIKTLSQEGLRIVLLCESGEKSCNEEMSRDNKVIAIIAIEDNIRKDAKDTIEWFASNDVEIKVISGDNVDTVRSIAQKVGIKNCDKYISLAGLSDDEVAKVASEYTIFGRVTPEQKCIIIRELRKQGKRVAMTGDGVNDILAFKECDCAIAMASGSEACKGASNLIMLNSDFSAMPSIVMEGRRVINNISRASSLFLTKTFFTMFLTIFVLISRNYTYPLSPNQIILWETFFIGLPAFFLALQPNKDRVSGSFIASLTSKALPGAMMLFLGAIASYIYCNVTHQIEIIPTIVTYTATFGAFTIMLNLLLPLNLYRGVLAISMLGLCFGALYLAPSGFFSFAKISIYDTLFVSLSVLVIALLYPLIKLLFEKFFSSSLLKKKKVE